MHREFSLFDLPGSSLRIPTCRALIYWTWLRARSRQTAFSLKHLLKQSVVIVQNHSSLRWRYPLEQTKEWAKNVKGNIHLGVLKSSNKIPGDLACHIYVWSCTCAQKRPQRTLLSHLLLTLRLFTNRKWRLKQGCTLLSRALKACSNKHTETLSKAWGTCLFQEVKRISL